jgi:lipopolysaccharide export system permease protein
MYQDSEMVVWFASGRGLSAFLRPLLRFAWPILVLITFSALIIWPWTNQQSADMKQRYDQRGDLERIAPGQFQESANGQRVFFIDSASEGRVGSNNIFIATAENTKNTVTTARAGRVELANDVQMLVLQNGQRLEKTIGKQELRISDFEEYGIVTGQRKDIAADAVEIRAMSTLELLKSNIKSHQAELSWRFGLVFSAINFVVFGAGSGRCEPPRRTQQQHNFRAFDLHFVQQPDRPGANLGGQRAYEPGQLVATYARQRAHRQLALAGQAQRKLEPHRPSAAPACSRPSTGR